MKIIRKYATKNNAINVEVLFKNLIELEVEKIANNIIVNSPTSLVDTKTGGELA
ncbi:hypothetical protein ACFVRR_15045 [Gottfriedia sp. NPDC057948]|uniref:hypothetical protein n=1 Tax=Gottfriedia sp. NPDC057948 TaxID=3346287 RepID=UPI0036DB40A9